MKEYSVLKRIQNSIDIIVYCVAGIFITVFAYVVHKW